MGLAKYKQPAGLFETYSLGFATGRDAWSYSFGQHSVVANIGRLLAHYNSERERYRSSGMRSTALASTLSTTMLTR